jgi:DNA-directed RNA polymerase subunit RPC12/RpoP
VQAEVKGRDICQNCGTRRLLKAVPLINPAGEEVVAQLCRPCHSAIKTATRERAKGAYDRMEREHDEATAA